MQKQTFGEVGTKTVVSFQVMSKMFVPKIIKICHFFFKSQSIMLGMLFDVFSFISTHISSVLFSHVVQKQTLDEVERLFDGQLYQKYSY